MAIPGIDQDTIVRSLMKERGKLFAYIWSIVRDEHVAEDTLQEVSMLVLRKREQIKDEEHLLGWMRIASRNKAFLALRNMRHRPRTLDDSILDLLDEQWAEHDTDSPPDDLDALRHCMSRLTPRARELVKLRYVEGISGQALADRVNQTLGSVYVAVSRIHRNLAQCISTYREEGVARD